MLYKNVLANAPDNTNALFGLATLYHRVPILEPDLRAIGFGAGAIVSATGQRDIEQLGPTDAPDLGHRRSWDDIKLSLRRRQGHDHAVPDGQQVLRVDAGVVGGRDLPAASDRQLLRARFDRDQRSLVLVLILVFRLALRAGELHHPVEDLLPVSRFRAQPHALQAVRCGLAETVGGGVANRELHQAVNL